MDRNTKRHLNRRRKKKNEALLEEGEAVEEITQQPPTVKKQKLAEDIENDDGEVRPEEVNKIEKPEENEEYIKEAKAAVYMLVRYNRGGYKKRKTHF